MSESLIERLNQLSDHNTDPDIGIETINDGPNSMNYKELIKNELANMSEDEILASRKEALRMMNINDEDEGIFESRIIENDDIESTVVDDIDYEDDDPIFIPTDPPKKPEVKEPVIKKTAAELYEEKHPTIKKRVETREVKVDDSLDPGATLFDNVTELEKENSAMSKKLFELQAAQQSGSETKESATESTTTSAFNGEGSDSIDDILKNIEEVNDENESSNNKSDNDEDDDDIEELLNRLESEKVYAHYEPTTEPYKGPADYVVMRNSDYENTIENILNENGIKVTKKSQNEKNAILNAFVTGGDEVTVALVNSGIYVTMSGASTTEIISMNTMNSNGDDGTRLLERLNIINNHIVNSSVGKMRLSQLIEAISYQDIETLYYALYAATYPDTNELVRTCTNCEQNYYIKVNTKDMLINGDDYDDEASKIRDNVTTFAVLRETSKLNKTIRKQINNKMIIDFKHPNIRSYISTLRNIDRNVSAKYPSLVDLVFDIDKIYIYSTNNDGSFVEFTDPNSHMELIGKIKDPNVKYELFDIMEEIRENAVPSYGFKETHCPHCGNVNPVQSFAMDNLLFTQAQAEDEMATLRWAARLQKRRKLKKK